MKVLAVAPDGTYAYGTSLLDAQNQLKSIGGDVLGANHYQVSDTHTAGKVNTVVDILIKEPRLRHV